MLLTTVDQMIETTAYLRWLIGKIGFATAGLVLIVASRYQWKVGGTLRRIAAAAAVLGLAMQFIWIDAATIIHPIIGVPSFLWLIAIGAMLFMGRVERHFIASLNPERQ